MIQYEDYLKKDVSILFQTQNPSIGSIQIILDVPKEVEVSIYKEILGEKVLFFKGKTDSRGIIDLISLPAPKRVLCGSISFPSYENYQMIICNEENKTQEILISIFEKIKVIQRIEMKKDFS